MERRKPIATYPFSTALWTEYESFENLPILEKPRAAAFISIGLGTCALFIATARTNGYIDGVTTKWGTAWLIPVLLLLFTTLSIAYKQYHYYYGGRGEKDGIFVLKLRQANDLEENLDVMLVSCGGGLIAFTYLPTWWFLVVACYSALVVSRCNFTSKRDVYWRRSPNREGIRFIPQTLRNLHNGLAVRDVLRTWVITHIVFLVVALLFFLALQAWPSPSLFLVLWLSYLLLYLGLRYLLHPQTKSA